MAIKAREHAKYYKNENGPVIGTVTRNIIKKDGLYFKDIDGTGEVSKVNDWRLPAEERAKAYTKVLTTEEKVGQLFISDWRMGGKYRTILPPTDDGRTQEILDDETGLLDEGRFIGKTIFGEQNLPGTSVLIKEWFARHTILRANAAAGDMTDYLNQLQAVAEECEHFVPVSVASNSRNEHGEIVFGMNDAGGVFPAWPGTLGIAAAARGTDMTVVDEFADCVRRTWNAAGLRKGYMYMADVMSDPRWQRSYGTFGEDPEFICEVFEHLIPRIQGSKDGVTADGVAMTVKHFPGGGARENGFDPHYKAGQWNVYQTPGSLEKYHLPGFQTAVDYNAASIMPYYAKPAEEKSAPQLLADGETMELQPYGFAYNKPFIDGLLRGKMGYKGYINSDTGIVHNMCWGVEMLDKAERIGFAVNQAGVDVISGLFDHELGMEAYNRGKNDYYDTHPVPEGFKKEDLVLTDECIDRAVTRTMAEMFELGMFDNPYRDSKVSEETAASKEDWDKAMKAHRQSVTLLKNDGMLPLTKDKLIGKKVYAEAFHKRPQMAERLNKELKELLNDLSLTNNPGEADIALLLISPSSGDYFTPTKGYLELDICENKEVPNVDDFCRPMKETHMETTLTGAGRIAQIAETVHKNGGKVAANVNVALAWLLGNVEPYVDALTVGYDTYPSATLDVMMGRFAPVGKLPITFPKGDDVLAVDENGVCISPNDVPGYDKDQYMPDEMKDENGKAYAYRDAAGNYYELGFGLSY